MKKACLALATALFLAACVNVNVHFPPAQNDQAKPPAKEKPAP